jgi:flagellar basal-body rod protein FlgG
MAFIKRAAAPGLALVLVAGLLSGVHWLGHAIHGWNGTTASMRSKLPVYGSAAGTAKVGMHLSPSTKPWALDDPSNGADCVLAQSFSFGGQNGNRLPICLRTAGIGSANRDPAPPPRPLPSSTNAVPLPPAGSDLPGTDEPSTRNFPSAPPPSRPAGSSGRRIIDKGLPDSTAEERDVWHEMMKDLPANDLRELLRLRTQLGRVPSSFAPALPGNGRSPEQPPLLPPESRTSERGLPPSWPSEAAFGPAGEPDPERVIRESLAAIESARQLIVHNIANSQTIGYKRRLVSFESGGDSAKAGPSTASLSRVQRPEATVDLGVRVGSLVFDMSQGKLRRTDRSLDLAIEGEGFFQLESPQGGLTAQTRYTRCGRFTTDVAGRIVLRTSRGDWLLQPSITIPPGSTGIEICADGLVRSWNARNHVLEQLGVIQTACIPSPDSLEVLEGSIFAAPKARKAVASGTPGEEDRGRLRAGFLEESNVDLKQEFAELERLDGEAHVLRQASRLLQFSVPDPPGAPVNGSPIVPGPSFPTARDERW